MRDAAAALVDRVLSDPPAVHEVDSDDRNSLGVWSTDRDCYVFLAENVAPAAHTLETGSGISTVLFAALGANHVCITPDEAEADRIVAYCDERAIDTASLRFEIGFSDEVLPRLPREPLLDVVFVDGNHGFPGPIIDWYYAGARVRPAGLLVMDDLPLPAVAHLCAFVDRDPRWVACRRTEKWVAYRRVGNGELRQEWFEQAFYEPPRSRNPAARLRRVGRLARRRPSGEARRGYRHERIHDVRH